MNQQRFDELVWTDATGNLSLRRVFNTFGPELILAGSQETLLMPTRGIDAPEGARFLLTRRYRGCGRSRR
jgi:hypothetical protein